MKEFSQETVRKIIKQAAIICWMHGDIAGNRCCQDWSGERKESPEFIFTDDELDQITYHYEAHNSNLVDYVEGEHFMGDEMVASFSIARALEVILQRSEDIINKGEE